jgi:uncharacterized surface anchored protein
MNFKPNKLLLDTKFIILKLKIMCKLISDVNKTQKLLFWKTTTNTDKSQLHSVNLQICGIFSLGITTLSSHSFWRIQWKHVTQTMTAFACTLSISSNPNTGFHFTVTKSQSGLKFKVQAQQLCICDNGKAVPQQTYRCTGGRGGIAFIHSRPRY